MLSFVEFMELVKKANIGFEFTMLQDSSGKCNGCMWKTSIMRDYFEIFGHYVSLDDVKRELNALLWNYTGVALINELGKLCMGCEAITCTERLAVCAELVRFMIFYSNRKSHDIRVVTADKIANHKFVTEDL